ncbi:hypothetical protein ABZ215_33435 [Amycolatopsis sp. NPDC006131]|uniref:hypothetical protein n=1 Tax=Amycolatopsis sp. NPDC006131 TaxID=3156731 RepID=UPI0033AF91E2
MNPVDRARILIDHAEANGLEDGLYHLTSLTFDRVGVLLGGVSLAQLVRWGDTLTAPHIEIANYEGSLQVNVRGAIETLAVEVCLIVRSGVEFERLQNAAMAGSHSYDMFRAFVGEVTE